MGEYLERGIYYFTNARAPVVIDMLSGDASDGARIGAWDKVDVSGLNALHQLWFIEPVDTSVAPFDTHYTIRNLRSGTYMGLANTTPYANGATLVGRLQGGDPQHWFIRASEEGTVRICNCITETYVDLNEGSSSNGAVISGWDWVGYGTSRYNQLWVLNRVSKTSEEIRTVFSHSSYVGKDLRVRNPGRVHLILQPAILQTIHRQSGLNLVRQKRGLYESDDFAFVFKAAVTTWADNNIHADGFGILCGVLFTETKQGSHAISWTLSSHEHDASVVFIDPQDGSLLESIPEDSTSHLEIF